MESKRYTKKTIEGVLKHLEELGLSVYGPYMRDNKEHCGCMDYDANDIINRRKLLEKGTLEVDHGW